jgi:hypothetical protein
MAAMTPAQEEFQSMIDKASRGPVLDRHPEDARQPQERDEEDDEHRYQRWKVQEELKQPSGNPSSGGQRLNLPPPDFDNGRTTGVKGVIADARSYEQARWAQPRGSVGNKESRINSNASLSQNHIRDEDQEGSDLDEEEEFIGRWREERIKELAREGNDIRNRRTSPSVRRYGRFDEVDALGYLDAIEKVGKETKVVVFVYDSEVSSMMPVLLSHLLKPSSALSARSLKKPLYPSCHYIPQSTLSKSTTTTSNLIMLPCRLSWLTETKVRCLQILHISLARFQRIRCSIPRH